MIEVTLNTFMGMEKLLGGKKSQVIVLPQNSTVRNLLQEIAEIFGENLAENVMSQSLVLKTNFVIMVNGVNIFAKEGYDTKLNDGDRVLFFPPVAGG